MRVAIVSDIHGNRHAFEAVLAAAHADDVDAVWCLGDLVGYGADPDACVALAVEHADVCLAGNHDMAVTGAISLDDFSAGAALAARWTIGTISTGARDWLAALAPAGQARGVALYHASPRDPVWEYVLSVPQAAECLDAADAPVSLIGHSHVALAFHHADGEATKGHTCVAGHTAELAEERWLLNPGSVGQPRDGDARAAWMLLDLEARTATWRREAYDVGGAAGAILAAGLPDALAERLTRGQ
jgi:predicted phosphodiesterase